MIEPGPEGRPGDDTRFLVSPYAVGGGFLAYCIAEGWVQREGSGRGSVWYVTASGMRELEERFGIHVHWPASAASA